MANRLIERFGGAATQLGSSNETIRLAGLLAMSQLADQWEPHRQACIDVICAHARLSCPDASSELTRRAAVQIVIEHLRPDAQVSWVGARFDLSGIELSDADFSNLRLTGGLLSFDKATFVGGGRITFDQTQFAGADVIFRGASIRDDCRLTFDNARFESGSVSFKQADFGLSTVTFAGATLGPGCDVDFAEACMYGPAAISFSTATVHGSGLHFTGTKFLGQPNGVEADISFHAAVIDGTLDFTQAEFHRSVALTDIDWRGGTLLLTAASLHAGSLSLAGYHGPGATISVQQALPGPGRIEAPAARAGFFRYVGSENPALFFGHGPWPYLTLPGPPPTATPPPAYQN